MNVRSIFKDRDGAVIEYVLVAATVAVIIALAFTDLPVKIASWFHQSSCMTQQMKGRGSSNCSVSVTPVAPPTSNPVVVGGGGGVTIIPGLPGQTNYDPNVAVYYDASYPTSWISNSSTFATFLNSNNFKTYNAVALKDFINNYLSNPNGKSIIVMTQDMCPDTICDQNIDSNSLIRLFMNEGGTVIWEGNIPFYYLGHSNGTYATIGDAGPQNLLGLSYPNSFVNYTSQSTFTPSGGKIGLTYNHNSYRTEPISDNIIALTTEPNSQTGSWFKNYAKGYPDSGFYRYDDSYFDGSNSIFQSEVLKIIKFAENKPSTLP